MASIEARLRTQEPGAYGGYVRGGRRDGFEGLLFPDRYPEGEVVKLTRAVRLREGTIVDEVFGRRAEGR